MINGRTRLHVVANGTMTGQRYIDEVLFSHVRLFRGAVGDKFVFMDENATCDHHSGLSRQRGYSTSRMASAFSRNIARRRISSACICDVRQPENWLSNEMTSYTIYPHCQVVWGTACTTVKSCRYNGLRDLSFHSPSHQWMVYPVISGPATRRNVEKKVGKIDNVIEEVVDFASQLASLGKNNALREIKLRLSYLQGKSTTMSAIAHQTEKEWISANEKSGQRMSQTQAEGVAKQHAARLEEAHLRAHHLCFTTSERC
ncbi:hypothetical protein TNCV_938981 [Trichonephila clavipes]|nr:hypothetical protein TNCV_938981 [Trichonephila clavipes]